MEANNGRSIIGWFRQHFGKPKTESNINGRSKHTQNSEIPTILESSCVYSFGEKTSCDSVTNMESKAQSVPSLFRCSDQPVLPVQFHLTRKYDVCVCHSDDIISQAQALVSFLETPSRGLRCYLQTRDCPLGGAISSELCKAVQSSHCLVLLISPNFLQDEWCLFQMHQAISEGPMSQRIIPAILDMHISEIPHELRFFYFVDLSRDLEDGFTQVYKTVNQYLKNMSFSHSGSSTEDHVGINNIMD